MLQKLAGGRVENKEGGDLGFQVRLLAETLPDFLTFEIRAAQGEVLRINRSLDPRVLRDRVTTMCQSSK